MVKVNPTQAKVYRLVKAGKNITEIAKEMKLTRDTVSKLLNLLSRLDLLAKGGRHPYPTFTALDKEFIEVKRLRECEYQPLPPIISKFKWNSQLTEAQRKFIVSHYKKMDRRTLAKELGISKVLLNFEIEGLRGKGLVAGV